MKLNRLALALIVLSVGAASASAKDGVLIDIPDRATYDPVGKSVMDDLAGADAVAALVAGLKNDWTVFTEDRAHSIRWSNGLPKRWLADLSGHAQAFKGKAQPGEFFVFQLGLFAAKKDIGDLYMMFSDLTGPAGTIPHGRLRCFQLDNVDCPGRLPSKQVSVAKGKLQALWVGIDVPADAKGLYQGTIKVKNGADASEADVAVRLDVAGEPLADHGDRDSWRLSRLRWLDSTIGLDDNVVTKPYTPIRRKGNTLKILGRELTIGENGLPAQIRSFFNEGNTAIERGEGTPILAEPFRLVVETEKGEMVIRPGEIVFSRQQAGAVEWHTCLSCGPVGEPALAFIISGLMEYDGFVRYRCDLLRQSMTQKIRDIRLEFAVRNECAKYFMGLGRRGGLRPSGAIDWKWDPKVNQDGFWMGAVNAGFKLQLKGYNFQSPLINCYYQYRPLNVPESWGGTDGRGGGIRLMETGNAITVRAASGPREIWQIQQGNSWIGGYNFDLFLTPFKPLATDEQWAVRYFHASPGVEDPDLRDLSRVKAKGANLLNIHQSKEQNPTINYPYYEQSMPLLKKCVADAHQNGIKAKVYYTTREITNNLPELFAFWSMNGEIICPGPGKEAKSLTNPNGPHSWLLEHLGTTGYIPAWRDVLGGRYKGMLDLSVLTTPDSRLDNFYLEGLDFMLREIDIDGIYVDDTALDRKAFQRAHRIFEKAGKRLLADMHSWSHFNPDAGMTPSAYCYMQGFPYYHRLWYGEAFGYDTPPDYWLVEMSGIPFGLMGEMLEGGGNPWRGAVFGMTNRLGWQGDPRPIWRLRDEFGMAGTELLGFWDPRCPIKTDNPDVRATVFRKPGKSLVAIANWTAKPAETKLQIDWESLGLDGSKATLHAPKVERFQEEKTWKPTDSIAIEPGKGWMIIIE